MDECDIMRNMSHCIKGECSMCEYSTEEECRKKMMRDANCIMKMQHDAIKDFPAEIERLKAEIARLTPMAKFNFDEATLVRKVNEIVSDCYEADPDFCYDGEENSYIGFIHSLLEFGEMLPGNYGVMIADIKEAPKLVKSL